MQLAKTLIRKHIWAGWSELLLVTHTTLLEISCHGPIDVDYNILDQLMSLEYFVHGQSLVYSQLILGICDVLSEFSLFTLTKPYGYTKI